MEDIQAALYGVNITVKSEEDEEDDEENAEADAEADATLTQCAVSAGLHPSMWTHTELRMLYGRTAYFPER